IKASSSWAILSRILGGRRLPLWGWRNKERAMAGEKTYDGRCFCGDVALKVTGEPVAMGYCHCASCREWSAGPINAFTLWKPDAVRITRGADSVGSYAKSPNSVRKWCKTCG